MRINRIAAALLLGLPMLFLLLFFVIPFFMVVFASLQTKDGAWTLSQYARMAFDSYYLRILFETFQITLWVTLITLPVGYCLAYYLAFYVESALLRRFIYVVLLTPLFISGIVRTFGWVVILGRNGLANELLLALGLIDSQIQFLNSRTSVVIGLSYVLLPFMVLTVGSVLQNINRSLLEAARDLGAGPVATFLRVTFPLSLPGIIGLLPVS